LTDIKAMATATAQQKTLLIWKFSRVVADGLAQSPRAPEPTFPVIPFSPSGARRNREHCIGLPAIVETCNGIVAAVRPNSQGEMERRKQIVIVSHFEHLYRTVAKHWPQIG
jgi:hypothetical protein